MAERSFDRFYLDYEEKYRGSREEILDRLRVYRPLLAQLREKSTNRRALDYGCGRGEWLETVVEEGFDALGIDSNSEMVMRCDALELPARSGDVIAHAALQPPASVALLTAFHLIEHLPFDSALGLIERAHAMLESGGVLIVETPNPENLSVGACTFYSDPTHQRPVPPTLLSFCAEFVGFDEVLVVRLNTASAILGDEPTLWTTTARLVGASPDYAVIALKTPDDALRAAARALVERVTQPHPLSLEPAVRFDATFGALRTHLASVETAAAGARVHHERVEQAVVARIDRIDGALVTLEASMGNASNDHAAELQAVMNSVSSVQTRIGSHETAADEAHRRIASLEASMVDAEQRASAAARQLGDVQAGLLEVRRHYEAMCATRSWRWTAPLRRVVEWWKGPHDP